MIHACGMVDLAGDVAYSPDVVAKARPLCTPRADPVRRADGGQRHHPLAPAGRQRGVCTLGDPLCRPRARRQHRSGGGAGSVGDRLAGASFAIGNAPTAFSGCSNCSTPARPARRP